MEDPKLVCKYELGIDTEWLRDYKLNLRKTALKGNFLND